MEREKGSKGKEQEKSAFSKADRKNISPKTVRIGEF